MPIEQLTSGMARGDARAVENFYRQYFDYLYAQASRATRRDEAFCLDVVQEAVLRILRSIRPAQTVPQFRAWLNLVVQTTAYDLLRSESRRRRRERVAVGPGGEPAQVDADRLDWLREQIARLDPEIVRIIELRFDRQWTLARIAAAMGLTIGAIDGRLRRALTALRDHAQEVFDD